MSRPLAIFTPQVGSFSETFIRRHIERLLPGGVVVVTQTTKKPYAGNWSVACPLLVLDSLAHSRGRRWLHGIGSRLGLLKTSLQATSVEKFLRENGVHTVLVEYLDHALCWLRLARDMNLRLFAHAHGYDISAYLQDERWRSRYPQLNDCAGVITMSHVSKQALHAAGLRDEKLHVVPYGVDVPAACPARLDNPEIIRCVAVGITAQKAPILTLDAFRRAAELHPGLHLDFIGRGELLAAMEQYVRAFRLGQRVTLHGAQHHAEVLEHLRGADLFLQHSMVDPAGATEGLPVAILEAMAAGLPVISTLHAGIPEAVVEGETGFLVQEGDSVTMGERISQLVLDSPLRKRMGQAAWKRATDHFSSEKQRASLLQIMDLASLA
jgi:glycosyltransferase involved in cell wall biosynthesis